MKNRFILGTIICRKWAVCQLAACARSTISQRRRPANRSRCQAFDNWYVQFENRFTEIVVRFLRPNAFECVRKRCSQWIHSLCECTKLPLYIGCAMCRLEFNYTTRHNWIFVRLPMSWKSRNNFNYVGISSSATHCWLDPLVVEVAWTALQFHVPNSTECEQFIFGCECSRVADCKCMQRRSMIRWANIMNK